MNTKQLVKVLKNETIFEITKDGKDMLLYTQHFMLSGKDHEVFHFIEKLKRSGYIKDDVMYTWGAYGIHPSEYYTPTNVVELYHKYMDGPRSAAEYTLHAYVNEFGKVSGYVFAIENADNEVLAEKFFKMLNNSHYEFTHTGSSSFIVDGKHIVAPLNVYRTSGFKVVKKMGGAEDEEN
nr:MAG TPA: hypothetical protein [Caudoviricetes sp.]